MLWARQRPIQNGQLKAAWRVNRSNEISPKMMRNKKPTTIISSDSEHMSAGVGGANMMLFFRVTTIITMWHKRHRALIAKTGSRRCGQRNERRTDELLLLKQIFLIYFECFLCWALSSINFNFMSGDEIVMIIHLIHGKSPLVDEVWRGTGATLALCTF